MASDSTDDGLAIGGLGTASAYGGGGLTDAELNDLISQQPPDPVQSGNLSSGGSFAGFIPGLETIGSGLLNAFVVQPQSLALAQQAANANASLAEQQQLQAAGIAAASTNTIFTYLLLGLGIFLIFGFLERK